MLVALIILNVYFVFRKSWRKEKSVKMIEMRNEMVIPVNDDSLPFHPETNLEQFIDNMSKVLNCQIQIKKSRISTTLNARPVLRSLFGKRHRRKYIIRINTRNDFDGIKLDEVPLEAKIGLWFHELMHIKDYQSRTIIGIINRGIQYLTTAGKRIFEHEIDRMVIMSGYGKYLYHWSQYSMKTSNASDRYKAFKALIYLSPEQIQEEITMKQLVPVYNTAS